MTDAALFEALQKHRWTLCPALDSKWTVRTAAGRVIAEAGTPADAVRLAVAAREGVEALLDDAAIRIWAAPDLPFDPDLATDVLRWLRQM